MSNRPEKQHCISCGDRFNVTSDTGFHCPACMRGMPEPYDQPVELRKAYEQHLYETDRLPLDRLERLLIDCFIDFLNDSPSVTPLPRDECERIRRIEVRRNDDGTYCYSSSGLLPNDEFLKAISPNIPLSPKRESGTLETVADTYDKPANGWTCFHCGETFTTEGGAMTHFGATPINTSGCLMKVKPGDERGWLMHIRKLEEGQHQLSIMRDVEYALKANEWPVDMMVCRYSDYQKLDDIVDGLISDIPLIPTSPCPIKLFKRIRHGDSEHQEWLRKELGDYWGVELPPLSKIEDQEGK